MKRNPPPLFFFYSIIFIFSFVVFIPTTRLEAQEQTEPIAPKPLYSDPVYNGAADPTVIWNEREKGNGSCSIPTGGLRIKTPGA